MDNTSRTVNKAIDILEIFLLKDGGLSLTEIAKATRLNTATVYRLISTLAKRGYLTQYRKKGTYSIGLKLMDFNYAIRRNLKFIDFAYLSLSKLCKEYNVSSFLAVLDADSMLVVEEIGTSGELRINSPIGKRLPLYCTACGKVLLAALSEEERKAYYGRVALQQYTPNSITDTAKLEKELAVVRKEGVAFHREEYRQGVWTVAAPIYNGSEKVIAAAAVILPITYVRAASISKYSTAIKGCTGEISQIIGRIS